MTDSFFRRVVSGAYSGLQRYPRHLAASVRDALRSTPAVAASHPAVPLHPCHDDTPDLAATWIGHATVLLRMGDLSILTDPVFSNRIGMSVASRTLGLARLAPPALRFDDLPPVDLVLLSHAHFDHLDKPTLKALASDRTLVITAFRTRRLVPRGFAEVLELDWGESYTHKGLTVSALQPAHWGARTALDHRRGFNSYLLESGGASVFFAGDTAHTHAFRGLRDVDLALFGIGAYEPWINAHANPEQVWEMFTSMGARTLLPMHHSTFELGREPLAEPLDRLHLAARDGWDRVVARELGETWRLPSDPAT